MTLQNIEIRSATLHDAPAIRHCVSTAYEKYIDRIGKPPGPMLDDYPGVIDNHRVYVATMNEPIIGILVLKIDANRLLMDNVAVDPHHQGHGIGRQLIAFAEEQAKNQGQTRLWLYTHALMTENIAMYGKMGYEEIERRREYGYERVYMSKTL